MRLPVVGIQVLLITTSTLRLAAAPSPPSVELLSAGDHGRAGDGTFASLEPCNGTAAGQRWRLRAGWGDNATLVNAALAPGEPLKCLAVEDFDVDKDGARVGEWGCGLDPPTTDYNQQWFLDDQTHQLRVATRGREPGLCLSTAGPTAGSGLFIHRCLTQPVSLQWTLLGDGGLALLGGNKATRLCLSTPAPPPPGPAQQLRNTSFSHIRGFSYQPYFPSVGGTGAEIWGNPAVFDVASIDADFAAAKKTFPKVNMMRLWMSLDGFISNPGQYSAQFDKVLALGPKHSIRFVVTILNRWESVPNWGGQSALSSGYEFCPSAINGDGGGGEQCANGTKAPHEAMLEALVLPHANDDAVLVWDIMNEPQGGDTQLVDQTALWLRNTAKVSQHVGVSSCCGQATNMNSHTTILIIHPYCPQCYIGGAGEANMASFSQSLDRQVVWANSLGLPMIATETCWGSLNDTARSLSCSFELGELAKRRIGFAPHALRYSHVADLHDYSDGGPVGGPGYMAFLGKNRELRPHHDMYNNF